VYLWFHRKPGCRRIVEWAKKTGRIQGSEQQELLEFARKTLEQAEKNGDIFKPQAEDEEEPNAPRPTKKGKAAESAPLVGTPPASGCLYILVELLCALPPSPPLISVLPPCFPQMETCRSTPTNHKPTAAAAFASAPAWCHHGPTV